MRVLITLLAGNAIRVVSLEGFSEVFSFCSGGEFIISCKSDIGEGIFDSNLESEFFCFPQSVG